MAEIIAARQNSMHSHYSCLTKISNERAHFCIMYYFYTCAATQYVVVEYWTRVRVHLVNLFTPSLSVVSIRRCFFLTLYLILYARNAESCTSDTFLAYSAYSIVSCASIVRCRPFAGMATRRVIRGHAVFPNLGTMTTHRISFSKHTAIRLDELFWSNSWCIVIH